MANPEVLIYRGIPGSGKTYFARCFSISPYDYFSADNFFYINWEYKFDSRKLNEAHEWCFRKYSQRLLACVLGEIAVPKLVVDNTNIHAWELAPYVQMAKSYGCRYKIITIWCDPKVAIARNIHSVPEAKILQMYESLKKEKLPYFWNISDFYNEEDDGESGFGL